MGTPFLGEIKMISWNFAPRGWAFCNGQAMPINQNQALFSIMGTTYGGNGQTTFALPNLQGKTPIHEGNGHTLGESAGVYNHTLSINEMPQHKHIISANSGNTNATDSPANNTVLAGTTPNQFYSDGSGMVATPLNAGTLANTGGSQAHNNMMPYLTINFIVALQGVFPSQN